MAFLRLLIFLSLSWSDSSVALTKGSPLRAMWKSPRGQQLSQAPGWWNLSNFHHGIWVLSLPSPRPQRKKGKWENLKNVVFNHRVDAVWGLWHSEMFSLFYEATESRVLQSSVLLTRRIKWILSPQEHFPGKNRYKMWIYLRNFSCVALDKRIGQQLDRSVVLIEWYL